MLLVSTLLASSLWTMSHLTSNEDASRALNHIHQHLETLNHTELHQRLSSPVYSHYSASIKLPALSKLEQARLKHFQYVAVADSSLVVFRLAGNGLLSMHWEQFWDAYMTLAEAEGIVPIERQPAFTSQRLFILILVVLVATGLFVYFLVSGFEMNLEQLQRASSRIANGHLNSRVKVDEEKKNTDPFSRLGFAFNRMANQIQRLMGVQREMIRAVSHELRTPVARMRFGIQMLEDSTDDQFVHKQLHAMDNDLQELDELVDEILTYARLEEGGPILEFERNNMLDLVHQIVEETRRRTDKVTIQAHSDTVNEARIFSDIEYRYLHRAVQNLVGNACRYAKSQVHIEYHCDEQVCRIDVEDDGEGIPEKDWERVFTPFTRLDDSRTRSSGGYGLGLSIVQRIIYWHGGQASVGRSRWGGAKMSLVWPQYREH
ncbi:HAMP domain-containing protein [Bermanella marisrubri]|uniref:histidine kinase n=2 Tax=Bermanella marisrubri TaxID=207949 RepID=Q1N5X1_9GAMM|nr:Signal transduction histidine kinase [Oceanobacter sp. RED65] [Bermanella marisrubri]QIZ84587.1 HAMP domain-containing protein [Bermanella marisrubri]